MATLPVLSGIFSIALVFSFQELIRHHNNQLIDDIKILLLNVFFVWLPQAIVLGLVGLSSVRRAAISGIAITLNIYFICFAVWVFSRSHPESMAWLLYIFSFPGAAIGASIGEWFVKQEVSITAYKAGKVAGICTLIGLILNQFIVFAFIV